MSILSPDHFACKMSLLTCHQIKISKFLYLIFNVLSCMNVEGWLKICILHFVYNQIWLNFSKNDCHFFVHLFIDDCHFGYINNFLKKRHWFQSVFYFYLFLATRFHVSAKKFLKRWEKYKKYVTLKDFLSFLEMKNKN